MFDKWLETNSQVKGYLGLFDDSLQDDLFKSNNLNLGQVKDVFILLLIGLLISIAGFFFETFVIWKTFINNFIRFLTLFTFELCFKIKSNVLNALHFH